MTLAIALEPTPIETDAHGVVRVAKTRVTTYLAERQRQADIIQQEVEQRFNPVGIRERLLARRTQAR